MHYDLSHADPSKCWLELTYPESVKTINGDWRVSFQPDAKAAKAGNKTIKVNKKFTIGENEFKITKIDFSPSATVVHIEGKGVPPLAVMDIGYLKAQDDAVYRVQTPYTVYNVGKTLFKDVVYSGEISFEPVYDARDISMVIGRAKLPKDVNIQVMLDTRSLNEQSVMLDGEEFLLSFSETENDNLAVALKNQYPNPQNRTKIKVDKIYLIDPAGNRLYPEESKFDSAKNISTGNFFGEEIIFTFKDIKPGQYTLSIDSIQKFQNINQEVKLLD